MPHLEEVRRDKDLDMVFVLLTDISAGSSLVIFEGGDAEELIEEAFDIRPHEGFAALEGVVSRKKQFVPEIFSELQN
jgi:manganese-dependent inorganic pyrophosphatase